MYKTKYPLLIDYLRDEQDCILPVDEIIEIENLIDEDLNKRSEPLKCECKIPTFTRTVDEDFNCMCGKCGRTL